jgi:prophage antirepressor-like protein
MQYALRVFETEDHRDFRMLDIGGTPWFVLGDVCRALGLMPNQGSYYRHSEGLDDDEKQTVPRSVIEAATSPQKGEGDKRRAIAATTIIISESGLYSLVLRSRRPEAKRFRKWITSEVLPAIRKTGVYALRPTIPAFIARYNANWDRLTPGYFSITPSL